MDSLFFDFCIVILSICFMICRSQIFTEENTLIIQDLNIVFPEHSYGGASTYYNNKLYSWNGIDCNNYSTISCGSGTDNNQFALDISSLTLLSHNNTISLTNPSWIKTYVDDPDNIMFGGIGVSASIRINNYVWILHPGCCSGAIMYLICY